jgi:hypothetical protein
MKQGRYLFLAALAAGLAFHPGGQVQAAPIAPEQAASSTAAPNQPPTPPGASNAISRELHVKARVLGHRDIVLDLGGNISKIISNTPDDVTPDVYSLDTVAENQQPLTDELMREYRRLVPAGTAKYGILYDRQAAAARTTAISSIVSTPANKPTLTLASTNPNPTVRDLLIAVK